MSNRRSHLILVGLILAALAGVALLAFPSSPAHKKVTLGLDLQGGLEVVLKAVPPPGKTCDSACMDRSVSIMRSRIDKLGVSEPEIRKQGSDQIVIGLAGVFDQGRAADIIGQTAQLEFYDLQGDADPLSQNPADPTGMPQASPTLLPLLTAEDALPEGTDAREWYLYSESKSRLAGPAPTKEALAQQVLDALSQHDVTGSIVRVVDHAIAPGVEKDMGEGDAWPALRQQVLDADILLLSTPTWMGQASSVCMRVLERLDAEISEKDEQGRPSVFGKVAAVAVVGNEDGAHHSSAEVFQALNDVGFTIPANAVTYWVGEAMGGTDYQDLDERPEKTQQTTRTLAANLAHVARLLKGADYPPVS